MDTAAIAAISAKALERAIDGNIADDINRSVIQTQVEMGVAVRMAAMDLLAQNLRASRQAEVIA